MPRISASERLATRTRLIEAAKAEFAERGLAGARFDEISIAAGHAKGTIYNYFAGKDELFLAVVAEWCGLLVDAAALLPVATARQRLRDIAALDVDIARKDPELAKVVVQHMPALAGSERVAALAAIEPGESLLEAAFDRGLSTGEFRSSLPTPTLARMFLATLSAFELEALQPEPVLSLDDVVDLLDLHFLSGLAA